MTSEHPIYVPSRSSSPVPITPRDVLFKWYDVKDHQIDRAIMAEYIHDSCWVFQGLLNDQARNDAEASKVSGKVLDTLRSSNFFPRSKWS